MSASPAAPSPAGHRGRWWVGVIFLMIVHAALAWRAVSTKGPAVDEIYHVTGGYLYNRFGDFRIHPDNGILPQRLQGLPAALGGANPPALAGNDYWYVADNSVVSHQFFYGSGNNPDSLLRDARAATLVFSLGVVLLCAVWAARLGGDRAGLVAAGLAAFSPTLLAHGPLVTTDAAASLLLGGSAWAYWAQLARPGWRRGVPSGLLFGAACVTKFSAALLLPVFVLLALFRPADPTGLRPPTRIVAGWFVAHLAIAWLVVWAAFGFRHAMAAPDVPPLADATASWQALVARADWQGPVLDLLSSSKLVPEAWLYGYARTYVGTLARSAFLAGDYSDSGWRLFFPLAFLWKSTPAELVAAALTAILAMRRRARLAAWWPRLAPLLVFAGIYGLFSIFSRLNIGHRHLLPLYPVLFILGALAVTRLRGPGRTVTIAGTLLVASQAFSAVMAFPHHLAYFNFVAGGPSHGWRLLADSSVDWGQDLPALKTWLDHHNSGPDAVPLHLAYFGSDEPERRGVKAVRLPFVNDFKFIHEWYEPRGGLYCISATILQDVYGPVRSAWTAAHEKEYRELRRLEPQFKAFLTDPAARAALVEQAPATAWENGWQRYDRLRLARLCVVLRTRLPLASAGHSILIYRLTDEELGRILE